MDTDRQCGGCTACCKALGIIEIGKSPGKWCKHCTIGRGCQIYTARPEGCQVFKCTWLNGIGSENERPDKTNLVGEHQDVDGIGLTLCLFEVEEGALRTEYASRMTNAHLVMGVCVVHVTTSQEYTVIFPGAKPEGLNTAVMETLEGPKPMKLVEYALREI
jgi:hypothetical protein